MADHSILVPTQGARRAVGAYLAVFGAVLLLMMVLGLLMRLNQGGLVTLPPELFYQSMTVHGTGMVGVAGIGGAAVLWHFLGRYVRLTTWVFVFNLVTFVIGAAMILSADFIGGFAAAWTFLFPLPANAGGQWEDWAAAVHLGGLLLIGTGFLLFHLDTARAILGRYGSLTRALGWPSLFGSDPQPPPATVVASTMVLIVNILGLVFGASVLVISLINLMVPQFAIDAMIAKNMIYFFGHVFINATIYMAVIAVYELLPEYTGRPWKPNRPFLAAWTLSTVLVMVAYPHHLLMDFGMPRWVLIVGQIVSYISGLPILVVTAFGALMIVFRSGLRWDLGAGLLFVGVFGWAAGVIPAIIDATIIVNSVMHNTLWVPGHFHSYLLLGQVAMLLGFACWLGKASGGTSPSRLFNALAFWLFVGGGIGLTQSFLYSGRSGVPRRFAEYLPEWIGQARIGALSAALVVLGAAMLAGRLLAGLHRPTGAR
ncbi:cbb3-type cytochrome c oxidase subunit I [Magnetospirillum sp. SS-4]|uniref:cbb3-type cytochrome c oxidase subunit I n=1 Tax=Magnetospirillum sp. SS-4 TaxID=2681465 RepID=UPI0013807F4F|nr:cbb3-type cytochrome c oxidase subunit I [Magnetospirillum sp. SS-4]CAA7624973.1 Cytochrome c oxidase subunit I [Magnetospirillum sp. SS-4]